jgi:hypothetical protein
MIHPMPSLHFFNICVRAGWWSSRISRGADPNIWPRLPILLADGGFEKVETYVVQPMGTQREVKLLTPVTMENIDDTVIEDGHASQDEIDALIAELYRFAENPRPVAGAPCIVQAWGRGPHKLDRAHGL